MNRFAGILVVAAITSAACACSSPATTTERAPSPTASSPSSPGPSGPTTAPARTAKPAPVESNPPGDIPDDIAFLRYTNKAGGYSFTHPEGWAEVAHGATVTFTDKLNGISAEPMAGAAAPTVASAKATDVPALRSTQAAFELKSVTEVTLPAGSGVRIVYRRNSAPDDVTGRVRRDVVERYEIAAKGRLVALELYGEVGADNVDPWRIVSRSLRLA